MYYFYRDRIFSFFISHKRWLEISFRPAFGFRIEFPSDWHEDGLGTIFIAPVFFSVYLHFPWPWRYEDDGQCSGPQYGFTFYSDYVFLYYGNSLSLPGKDRIKILYYPWTNWQHLRHEKTGSSESYPFTYVLESGESQYRTATITPEVREWRRPWLPSRKIREEIKIEFSGEVGEETGSWKGGAVGCGTEVLPGETPLDALRRFERTAKL